MNFLLKIVEGPNKGAEIALVSGVAVTLGKGDDCDIVLADTTLPPDPVSIEASDDGVAVNGEPIASFAVKTVGATSFAVGPADAPWGELKWSEKAEVREPRAEEESEPADEGREADDAPRATSPAPGDGGGRKRGGCLGCLFAIVLFAIALAYLVWFYRAEIDDACKERGYDLSGHSEALSSYFSALTDKPEAPPPVERITLDTVAARYGLSMEERNGSARLAGNLKTRAERLRATAEAYAARPGVDLDLSDDESFRTAAEDALFTLTEGALKVVAATNRVLSVGGVTQSPETLRRTLMALSSDLPKMRGIDAARVAVGVVPKHDAADDVQGDAPADLPSVMRPASKKKRSTPSLPVCGILTKPYPCLVMRDGTRVMEGAALGGNVILKIDADAVTVTNSMGRFIWRP